MTVQYSLSPCHDVLDVILRRREETKLNLQGNLKTIFGA